MKNCICVITCNTELDAYKLLVDMKMDENFGNDVKRWKLDEKYNDKCIRPSLRSDSQEYEIVFSCDVKVKDYFVKKYNLENVYRSKIFRFNGEL